MTCKSQSDPPSDSLIIVQQPQSLTTEVGSSLTISVGTMIEERYAAYQWYRNGLLLPGHERSSLSIKQMSEEDIGFYSCMVSVHRPDDPAPFYEVSQPAALMMWREGSIIITGVPVTASGKCPDQCCAWDYSGYTNFYRSKPPPVGWYWDQTVNDHWVSLSPANPNAWVKCWGSASKIVAGCGYVDPATGHLDIGNTGNGSDTYLFTVFYKRGTAVPPGQTIVLQGFRNKDV